MYTIVLRNDKGLHVSTRETIVQYSNLADNIQFLVPTTLGDNDMTECNTVLLEYLTPVTHRYKTEFLTCSEELYKSHLQYLLPVDSSITAEAGKVTVRLSFYKMIENESEDGTASVTQALVLKTQPCHIMITECEDWSSFISRDTLSALDKKIVQLLALQKEIENMQTTISDYQTNLINDDVISETSTYSSKKIEEFIDQSELDVAIEEVEIGDGSTIDTDDIDSLFGDDTSGDDDTGDDSGDSGDDTSGDDEEESGEISESDIDNLF